jgi:hypothetical protein
MAHSHPIIQFLSARVCASEIHTQILRWVVKHLKHIIKIVVLGKRQIDANEHENMISRTGGDVSLKNVRSCHENCCYWSPNDGLGSLSTALLSTSLAALLLLWNDHKRIHWPQPS